MSDFLLIERNQRSWTFTLNRPEKMNALSVDMVEVISEGLKEAEEKNIQLLIFKGNGKIFAQVLIFLIWNSYLMAIYCNELFTSS